MSAAVWLRFKAGAGRLLLAGLVVSVVASVLWYRRQADVEQPQAPVGLPANNSSAEMVTRDFRHVETRMDRTIWVLESAQAEIFGDRANLHSVKVTWYGEPGEVTVVITSDEGMVDFRDRKARLGGDVRVARADGAELRTEKVLWDDRTKIMTVPERVVITAPGFSFQGESLEANLKTQRILLRGRVQGEIRGGIRGGPRPS